jgi:hypothetical protein
MGVSNVVGLVKRLDCGDDSLWGPRRPNLGVQVEVCQFSRLSWDVLWIASFPFIDGLSLSTTSR